MSSHDLNRIKAAGWLIVAAVFMTLGTWMCSTVVANSRGLAVVTDRQSSQYQQLREDIAELKELVGQAP